jgi:glycosidase
MPRKFIRDWSGAILKEYPRFWMVGEIFEEDSAQTAFFQGGKTGWDGIDTRLPSVFDFKLWRTSQEVFTGKKPVRALRDVLKYDGLYPDVNNVTVLANNHDTDRFMSLKGATKEGARLHLAFILATRGIPQLYAGEEILMTGGHDPDNRKDFPGGWIGDDKNAFTSSGRKEDEEETFQAIKRLIKIRKESDALKYGKTIDLFYNENIYVFARQFNQQTVIVGINISDKKEMLEFEDKNLQLPKGDYLLSPDGVGKNVDAISLAAIVDGKFPLILPAKSAVFYTVYTQKDYKKRSEN